SDSTHGYDVTDCKGFDPSLGGEAGFMAMSNTLRANGLGLILDFVPNHMGASVENAWWRDVLIAGEASHHAHYFDIDWQRYGGRVLLPILGESYGSVLASGDLSIVEEQDGLAVAYFDKRIPLAPETVVDFDIAARQAPEAIDQLLERQYY